MNQLKALFAGQSAHSRQELITQQQQLLTSWRNIEYAPHMDCASH
jgi:hypothetical protein